jgi:hypothetical protein
LNVRLALSQLWPYFREHACAFAPLVRPESLFVALGKELCDQPLSMDLWLLLDFRLWHGCGAQHRNAWQSVNRETWQRRYSEPLPTDPSQLW